MIRSGLTERLRGIIGGPQHTTAAPPLTDRRDVPADLAALGGEWRGQCFVIERRRAPEDQHGCETVGAIADRLDRASGEATMLAGGAPAKPPFLFFDLETTGLSGGAGTHAFLVGCGWFDEGAFVTRQFMLTRFADERTLLGAVASELSRAGALVSFNGKSFDAPVLETRYLFHRLPWSGTDLPHVDVLHPARRFWGESYASRRAAASASLWAAAPRGLDVKKSCSLGVLETQILGARRRGDVPGFEIPERYFQFVRSGDARPLAPVLEHNRLDLLSLAGLTARLLELVRSGPRAARDARERLALGHVYARAGFDARAREAYADAVTACRSPRAAYDVVRVDALKSLALAWRRARQFDEAALCWERLLEMRGCPPHVAREATDALAIHHEHRVRDLEAAKIFALRSLETAAQPGRDDAARHRLARLERKLGTAATEPPRLFPSSSLPS